jgi:hypothetical protein
MTYVNYSAINVGTFWNATQSELLRGIVGRNGLDHFIAITCAHLVHHGIITVFAAVFFHGFDEVFMALTT